MKQLSIKPNVMYTLIFQSSIFAGQVKHASVYYPMCINTHTPSVV